MADELSPLNEALEPLSELVPGDDWVAAAMISQAISTKRLADAAIEQAETLKRITDAFDGTTLGVDISESLAGLCIAGMQGRFTP